MGNTYSMEDVLDFLTHASERGLMPAATATALGVAVRSVLGVLGENERNDLGKIDLNAVVKRFTNKRARDFSPGSLKEYGHRVQRAMGLYQQWRDDPANFTIKTRTTSAGRKKRSDRAVASQATEMSADDTNDNGVGETPPSRNGGYATSISIRPDWVVTITNVPADLEVAEAERLAKFIKLLASE